jgi:hypothetical protein
MRVRLIVKRHAMTKKMHQLVLAWPPRLGAHPTTLHDRPTCRGSA